MQDESKGISNRPAGAWISEKFTWLGVRGSDMDGLVSHFPSEVSLSRSVNGGGWVNGLFPRLLPSLRFWDPRSVERA